MAELVKPDNSVPSPKPTVKQTGLVPVIPAWHCNHKTGGAMHYQIASHLHPAPCQKQEKLPQNKVEEGRAAELAQQPRALTALIEELHSAPAPPPGGPHLQSEDTCIHTHTTHRYSHMDTSLCTHIT